MIIIIMNIIKGIAGLRNKRTRGDYPNYSIAEVG